MSMTLLLWYVYVLLIRWSSQQILANQIPPRQPQWLGFEDYVKVEGSVFFFFTSVKGFLT